MFPGRVAAGYGQFSPLSTSPLRARRRSGGDATNPFLSSEFPSGDCNPLATVDAALAGCGASAARALYAAFK